MVRFAKEAHPIGDIFNLPDTGIEAEQSLTRGKENPAAFARGVGAS
jgi:hypothetical protein